MSDPMPETRETRVRVLLPCPSCGGDLSKGCEFLCDGKPVVRVARLAGRDALVMALGVAVEDRERVRGLYHRGAVLKARLNEANNAVDDALSALSAFDAAQEGNK